MYRDKSLIPTEAIRMLALGLLAREPRTYAALAGEVRYFASRIVGPSLDILGSSIELLRHEGLVQGADAGADTGPDTDEARLTITDKGREALTELLRSNVRAPIDDVNKLVIALKMRFLNLLDTNEQWHQVESLIDLCNTELVRLEDLLEHGGDEPGHLHAWLEHDMGHLRDRIAWLERLRDSLKAA